MDDSRKRMNKVKMTFEDKPTDDVRDWEKAFEDAGTGNVKEQINNLIWMFGHPDMTLREAEKLAVEFYERLSHRKGE